MDLPFLLNKTLPTLPSLSALHTLITLNLSHTALSPRNILEQLLFPLTTPTLKELYPHLSGVDTALSGSKKMIISVLIDLILAQYEHSDFVSSLDVEIEDEFDVSSVDSFGILDVEIEKEFDVLSVDSFGVLDVVEIEEEFDMSSVDSFGLEVLGNSEEVHVATEFVFQREIKVLVCGDGGVGKTCFVDALLGKDFDKRYIATMGVQMHTVEWDSDYGKIVFKIWDIAGQEKFAGLRNGYYTGADALILFFDVTSRMTYKGIPAWYQDVNAVCGTNGTPIPTVLVGNKVDHEDRAVKPSNITYHRRKNLPYYDMSVKTGYNLGEPLNFLAKKLASEQ